MRKNQNFFERITQIIDYYNIKSINSFAIDYLKYDSSEKINRLKKPNTNPSFEILCDISNMFEDIDMNWLVAGKGKMLKENNIDPFDKIKKIDQLSFNYFIERYEKLAIENGRLTAELNLMKTQIKQPFNAKNWKKP
jgi:hypothetical protein